MAKSKIATTGSSMSVSNDYFLKYKYIALPFGGAFY